MVVLVTNNPLQREKPSSFYFVEEEYARRRGFAAHYFNTPFDQWPTAMQEAEGLKPHDLPIWMHFAFLNGEWDPGAEKWRLFPNTRWGGYDGDNLYFARSDTGAVELACRGAVRAQRAGAWTQTPLAARIDPSWFGRSLDVVFTSDKTLVVFYRDADSQRLTAAWVDVGATVAEVVDATPGVGLDVSAVRGPDGDLHVAYFGCGDLTLGGCSGELRYAVKKDGGFEPEIVEVVDAGPGAGAFASLALVNGSPVLACNHREANGLRVAVRSPDGTWSRSLIPGAGGASWASLRALPGCGSFCAWRDEGSGALIGAFF